METGRRGPQGSDTNDVNHVNDARSLSTEDLSGAGDTTAEARERPAEAPPAFPGEATSAGRPTEAAAGAEPAPTPGAGPDRAADKALDKAVDEAVDEPLLGSEQEEFRGRWQRIQGDFVDDPREAVGAADTLVAEVMQALARTFSDHKQALEGQWQRGEEVATEDLRVALQRYRSFFNRLLKT
ncbi:hypothetical protein [Streptomyces sp. NBC_00893]|uniref:hypothetical protein n=1 Tax=Streptomyces sp. NBC_00893 TaxID=2975862 RepID=UPI002256AC85|nr:hypothetical protein [Streptomyces sp. NBC_00893]MCX4848315.1 hypothetical protein [Streptomyces sp. NBC_00893]